MPDPGRYPLPSATVDTWHRVTRAVTTAPLPRAQRLRRPTVEDLVRGAVIQLGATYELVPPRRDTGWIERRREFGRESQLVGLTVEPNDKARSDEREASVLSGRECKLEIPDCPEPVVTGNVVNAPCVRYPIAGCAAGQFRTASMA